MYKNKTNQVVKEMRDLESEAKYTRIRNYERTPRCGCVWFSNSVKMFPSSPRKQEKIKGPDLQLLMVIES